MPRGTRSRISVAEAESMVARGAALSEVASRFGVKPATVGKSLARRRKEHRAFVGHVMATDVGKIVIANMVEAADLGLLSKKQICDLVGRWRDEHKLLGRTELEALEAICNIEPICSVPIGKWLQTQGAAFRVCTHVELSAAVPFWITDASRDDLLLSGQVEMAPGVPPGRPTYVLGAAATAGSEHDVMLDNTRRGASPDRPYWTIGHPFKVVWLSIYESSATTCSSGDGDRVRDRFGLVHYEKRKQLVTISFASDSIAARPQSRPHVFHSRGNRRFKTATDAEVTGGIKSSASSSVGATLDLHTLAHRGHAGDGAVEWVSPAIPYVEIKDACLTILGEVSSTRGNVSVPTATQPYADDDTTYASKLAARRPVALNIRLDEIFA